MPKFNQWNYISMELLAKEKKGQVSNKGDFIQSTEENFTQYYQPLISWINKLQKVVFLDGRRWKREDEGLYPRMREIKCVQRMQGGLKRDICDI